MKNTGIMCAVSVATNNTDEVRIVDLGNFFEHNGRRILITTKHLAKQYGHLVEVPIYVRRKEQP